MPLLHINSLIVSKNLRSRFLRLVFPSVRFVQQYDRLKGKGPARLRANKSRGLVTSMAFYMQFIACHVTANWPSRSPVVAAVHLQLGTRERRRCGRNVIYNALRTQTFPILSKLARHGYSGGKKNWGTVPSPSFQKYPF